jgi:DNA-binding NarL/FixJ family response regulator
MVQVKSLFTNREKEVIQYICQGLTNEEISKKLCISKFTIANHVQNIFEKTGIRSRAKLTSYYKYLS